MITSRPFGTNKAGEKVTLYTISNDLASVSIMDLGATITSFLVKDKTGKTLPHPRKNQVQKRRGLPLAHTTENQKHQNQTSKAGFNNRTLRTRKTTKQPQTKQKKSEIKHKQRQKR
mgnify:CR=1 FL=1